MVFLGQGDQRLDYEPCRYGESRLNFRGPAADLSRPTVCFLGGSATFGRFVREPFPVLTARRLGCQAANLGCVNAGLDVYLSDPHIMATCQRAGTTVVQLTGAHNLSNRLYTVHPRRNDRFIRANLALVALYPEVDFTQYNFTRHLLRDLREVCAERFQAVEDELKTAWVMRMRSLIAQLRGRIALLWIPRPDQGGGMPPGLGEEPLFVTGRMVDRLRPLVADVIRTAPPAATAPEGTEGMIFSELEAPAAAQMLGPQAHAHIAGALVARLSERPPAG